MYSLPNKEKVSGDFKARCPPLSLIFKINKDTLRAKSSLEGRALARSIGGGDQ